jgi:PIN domain nuclease of toxin-antitoxin system
VNILLDTHVLIWWVRDNARLGKSARSLIQSEETLVWISAASIWEISIKTALRRLEVLASFEAELHQELESSGFRPLMIDFDHAFAIRNLPLHHNDPFDRMLIAQAQCENLILITADPQIRVYDVRTIDASE